MVQMTRYDEAVALMAHAALVKSLIVSQRYAALESQSELAERADSVIMRLGQAADAFKVFESKTPNARHEEMLTDLLSECRALEATTVSSLGMLEAELAVAGLLS